MSTKEFICFVLDCDRCGQPYADGDSEGRYHGSTVEEIRNWAAVGDSWVILRDEDVCDQCAKRVGAERHEFRPGPDEYCAWCKEWCDFELHTNAPLLGQTEIPLAGDLL